MFAERLLRARKAAGLSMKKLGEQVGLSANAIKKYEHGDAMPNSANLLKLAKALDVRSEYFFRPIKVELEGVEYRKRASTPKSVLNKIDADVRDQAERWKELIDLYPDSTKPVKQFALPENLLGQIGSLAEIESVADQMREAWALGLNPIPDLIDTLEANGIMVICTAVETKNKFNGLAGKIGDTPLVVISEHQPGDRQRFTLAHELGHLVLSDRLAEDINEEKACDQFAGAFLLPKTSLLQHLGEHRSALEDRELHLLKHEFGISMMGILHRANQCGVISDNLKQRYIINFSKHGWRTKEPGDPYPAEETYLFKQLVFRALSENYIGESKASELLGKNLYKFHQYRKLEELDATAD